jgi:hypothetical protein
MAEKENVELDIGTWEDLMAQAKAVGEDSEIDFETVLRAMLFLHEIPIVTLRGLAEVLQGYLEGFDSGEEERKRKEGSDDAKGHLEGLDDASGSEHRGEGS